MRRKHYEDKESDRININKENLKTTHVWDIASTLCPIENIAQFDQQYTTMGLNEQTCVNTSLTLAALSTLISN